MWFYTAHHGQAGLYRTRLSTAVCGAVQLFLSHAARYGARLPGFVQPVLMPIPYRYFFKIFPGRSGVVGVVGRERGGGGSAWMDGSVLKLWKECSRATRDSCPTANSSPAWHMISGEHAPRATDGGNKDDSAHH